MVSFFKSMTDKIENPRVEKVWFNDDTIWLNLSDKRILGIPIDWFPRLMNATQNQRENYEISPQGVHWECVDEDISLKGLLEGHGYCKSRDPQGAKWQSRLGWSILGKLDTVKLEKSFPIRLKLTGILEICEEGGFHVYCKEIPGAHSEGETISECMENVLDAVKAIVDYRDAC